MAIRCALWFFLLVWLSGAGWSAVVPDGDRLPRDSGAPPLPGGRHDPSRVARPDKSSSPSKPLPGGHTPNGGTDPQKRNPDGSSASPGRTTGPVIPPSAGLPKPDKSNGSGIGSGSGSPPSSLFVLGGLLVLFIAWAGWKARQGDQED